MCLLSSLSVLPAPNPLPPKARMCITSPLWHRAMECDSQRRLGADATKRTGVWSQDHLPQAFRSGSRAAATAGALRDGPSLPGEPQTEGVSVSGSGSKRALRDLARRF